MDMTQMAGLDYGNRFRLFPKWANKDGVFHAAKIHKWIVRINNSTVAKFDSKSEAIKFFNETHHP